MNAENFSYHAFYNIAPTAYVLFKSGLITSRFLEPPEEMAIADLSKKKPKHWGKWEKTGNKITIQ